MARFLECEEILSKSLKSQFWSLRTLGDETDLTYVTQHFRSLLEYYILERVPGENVIRAENLATPGTVVEKLEIFFFMLFNGILQDNEWDRTVIEVTKRLGLHLNGGPLKAIITLHHPYYKAAREAIFASAVRTGDLDLVSSLIADGIDKGLVIQMGNCSSLEWASSDTLFLTPLEVAFYNSDVNLAILLIQKGVDVGRGLSSMSSAELITTKIGLGHAAQFRLLEIILKEDKTLSEIHILNALFLATKARSDDCARLLLDILKARSHALACNTKLLCIAATIGHEKMVDTLLVAGADVNGCIDYDFLDSFSASSPLTAAIRGGRSNIIRQLLYHGAAPDGPPKSKEPIPLHYAAYMDNVEAIELLHKFGANVNRVTEKCWFPGSIDFSGYTALQTALSEANIRAVHALL